jgi:hypothetical protein
LHWRSRKYTTSKSHLKVIQEDKEIHVLIQEELEEEVGLLQLEEMHLLLVQDFSGNGGAGGAGLSK